MKLQLDATADELVTKGRHLIKALVERIAPHNPGLAESLEKALRKESPLKYPTLRDLHEASSDAYQRQSLEMIADIDRVLRGQETKALRKGDLIPGGEGDKKKPSDFNAAAVDAGTDVEMEHTTNRAIAREIALDHLSEDPKYYEKLKTIHKADDDDPDYDPDSGEPIFDPKTGMSPTETKQDKIDNPEDYKPEDAEKSVGTLHDQAYVDVDGDDDELGPDDDEDEKEDEKGSGTGKVPVQSEKEVGKSLEDYPMAADAALVKAGPYKYKKRWKDTKGNWQYEYPAVKETEGSKGRTAVEDTGERWDDAKAIENLTSWGDQLQEAQALNPDQRDGVGFNSHDMGAWGSRGMTGTSLGFLRRLLKKYRRQITGLASTADYYRAGLGDSVAAATVKTVVDFKTGDVELPVDGRIGKAKFGDYLDIMRKLKVDGWTRWNGFAWRIPADKIADFPREEYARQLEAIGLAFELPEVWPPAETVDAQKRKARLNDEAEQAGLPDDPTADELIDGIKNQQVTATIVVKWHAESPVKGVDAGAFTLHAPYSPEFNNLFNNRSGQLTGITEYRKDLGHARLTYSLELAEEAIAKLKTTLPNWKIVTEGVREAQEERERYQAEIKKPIPEIQKVMGIDPVTDKPFTLFPYQNEGIRFLQARGGNAIIGDEMGCIDGDAEVTINRGGGSKRMKLSTLYKRYHGGRWDPKIPTFIRSLCDGELRLQEVKTVLDKGIRSVVRLTLQSGKELRLTSDHEVCVGAGQYLEASDLKPGNRVLTNGVEACPTCKTTEGLITYRYAKFRGHCRDCMLLQHRDGRPISKVLIRKGHKYIQAGLRYHPHYVRGGMAEHRLVYEARLNGLSLKRWLVVCASNSFTADHVFLDPKLLVHHKNEDPIDNRIENLELVTHSDHHKRHQRHLNFPVFVPVEDEVVSVEPDGAAHVYDVVCADPHRNFVANGVVVHNCGKTLQALGYAVVEKKRLLTVVPRVVRKQWIDEAHKFFPGHFQAKELVKADLTKLKKNPTKVKREYISHLYRLGDEGDLDALRTAEHYAENLDELSLETAIEWKLNLRAKNLVSINYEAVEAYLPYLKKAGLELAVIDESDRIKNPKAQITKRLQGLAKIFPHKILMSGTAIRNKRVELFTQAEMVHPGLFSPGELKGMGSTIGGAWHKARKIMISRQKKDVLPDLPPKTTVYSRQEMKGIPDITSKLQIGDISALKSSVAIAKAPYTADLVKQALAETDGKVIVFSDLTEAAKAIKERLGDVAVLHHGGLSDKRRSEAVSSFQDPKSGPRVFVSTIGSAGVGLNLQVANRVVFNDDPWTGAAMRQAEDRAHRATSTQPVNVIHVTAADNTWDETVSDIVQRKLVLHAKVQHGKQLTEEERAWEAAPLSFSEVIKQLQGEKAKPAVMASGSDESLDESVPTVMTATPPKGFTIPAPPASITSPTPPERPPERTPVKPKAAIPKPIQPAKREPQVPGKPGEQLALFKAQFEEIAFLFGEPFAYDYLVMEKGFKDHTEAIAAKDDRLYQEARRVVSELDTTVKDTDFDTAGGRFYGWSTNQLVDRARGIS